jgi:hypothetical protein
MASYPAYPILLDSSQEPEDGYDDDFSQPGIQHSRLMHASQYYAFNLLHNLTMAEFNSLFATFTAGPRDTYTLTYHVESPAATYSVKFTDPPEVTRNHGNGRFTVVSRMRGTKD